jgi:hypothetical protein
VDEEGESLMLGRKKGCSGLLFNGLWCATLLVFVTAADSRAANSTQELSGTFKMTIDTTLLSAPPSGDTVVCGVTFVVNSTTNGSTLLQEYVLGDETLSADSTTATCTISLAYAWQLPSLDYEISATYFTEVINTTATLIVRKSYTGTVGPFALPKNGVATSISASNSL